MRRSRGLYIETMENVSNPNVVVENIKWNNRRDEVYGLLCLSISKYLLFHLDGLTSPNDVWEKIQDLFWKTYNMRGYQLENELISLSPSSFEFLQLYFSKFKPLVLKLKQCGIGKEDEKIVLSIFLKLGHEYAVFVSAFHATKLTIRNWKIPSLVYFIESLTQEQEKLVLMGNLKPSKDKYLVVGNYKVNSKENNKDKKPPDKKGDKSKSQEESSNSQKELSEEER